MNTFAKISAGVLAAILFIVALKPVMALYRPAQHRWQHYRRRRAYWQGELAKTRSPEGMRRSRKMNALNRGLNPKSDEGKFLRESLIVIGAAAAAWFGLDTLAFALPELGIVAGPSAMLIVRKLRGEPS